MRRTRRDCMKQSKTSGLDRAKYLVGFVILAAVVLLGISVYFGTNNSRNTANGIDNAIGNAVEGNFPAVKPLNGSASQQAQNPASNDSVATGAGGDAQATPTQAKEVTIDFLYADWCGHCQAMKPIVAKLESELPKDRFEVRYWNEASRGDAKVAAIYTAYTNKGYFSGFPTFVANENDPQVGSMPEASFRAWVCSKFAAPKPPGC